MSKTTSFLHDGTIGDIWASLAPMQGYYKKTGRKAIYYLTNGQAAIYYEGAKHPTKNAEGIQVMLNSDMINMMIPLLKSQEYIEDAAIHNEEKIDIDMNRIRQTFVNMPHGLLSMWYVIVYPDLEFNLADQFLFVQDSEKDLAKGKIIIARTERYQNPNMDYSFLKEYEDKVIFSGTKKERNLFCMQFDLEIPRLEINDFHELAQAVKQSNGLISNQTMIFQIAEGLKTPRAVELCSFAPNVIPIGEKAYYYYAQGSLELYFHMLNGTDKEYKDKYQRKQENPTKVAGLVY